jgi:hypothetical protein
LLFAGALSRELFLGELFFGTLLLREILSPAFLAGRVFVECRTFIRLKSSTIVNGARAEPVSIRPSLALHMGFAVRTHASSSVDPPGTTILSPCFAKACSDEPDCGAA